MLILRVSRRWQGVARGHRLLSACIIFSVLCALSARAEPVGLVLEVIGPVTPEIQAFSELDAGQSFSLGEGSRIEFLHYATCQNIVAQGGSLTLSVENFQVRKGKIVDMSRADCPERVSLTSSSAELGGLVLRSGSSKAIKISRRPSFVFLGEHRASFTRFRVMRGDATFLQTSLAPSPAEWPENLAPLEPGDDYSIILDASDGPSHTVSAIVTRRSKQQIPVVVRLD